MPQAERGMDEQIDPKHTARFTTSYADTLAAYRLKTRPSWRRFIVAIFAIVLVLVVYLRLVGAPWDIVPVLIAGGLGLFAVFVMLIRLLMLPWWVRRIYRQQVGLSLETHLAWNDAGLFACNARGGGCLPWSDFRGRRESARTILLYHSDVLFQFIPRRALDAAQAESLQPYLDRVPLKR